MKCGNIVNVYCVNGFSSSFANVGTAIKIGVIDVSLRPNATETFFISLRNGNDDSAMGFAELRIENDGDIYVTPLQAGYNLAFSVTYILLQNETRQYIRENERNDYYNW